MNLIFIDNQVSIGPCLTCTGYHQYPCNCSSAHSESPDIMIRIISNQMEILTYDTIQPYEDQKNQPSVPPQEPSREDTQNVKKGKRSEIKDNTAHKRISKVLKGCYRIITGKTVLKEVDKLKHKVNYFLIILSHLQKKGDLSRVEVHFKQRLKMFSEKIKKQLASKPKYLEYLQVLVERHLEALSLFLNQQLEASMKALYDFKNMKHKKKFWTAMEKINEIRLGLGLSIEYNS